MKRLALTCLLAACAAVSARADIICLAPTPTTAGSIQITAPITFTLPNATTAQEIVLRSWVTSDGGANRSVVTPNLAYTLNGTAASGASSLYDNNNATNNDVGPNDGFFFFTSAFAVDAGTLTLSAGTYTLAKANNFNQGATETFTCNLFLAAPGGNRISGDVSAAAPEPSTWVLLGVAGLGVAAYRRRAART